MLTKRFGCKVGKGCFIGEYVRVDLGHADMITLEDNVITGGFGEQTADYICRRREDVHIEHVAVPDSFITHGSVDQLRKLLGMDAESVAGRVRAYRGRQEKKA